MPEEQTSNNASEEPPQEPFARSDGQGGSNQNPPSNIDQGSAPNNEDRTERLERDIKTGERWLIGVTAAGVVVNIIIAYFYYSQLGQMREAAQASTKAANAASESLEFSNGNFDRMMQRTIDQTTAQIQSAEAAKDAIAQAQKSLQASIDNFHQEQRAWVGIQAIICKTCNVRREGLIVDGVQVVFVNTGRTPALDVTPQVWAFWKTTKDEVPRLEGILAEQKSKALLLNNLPPEMPAVMKEMIRVHSQPANAQPSLPPNIPRITDVGDADPTANRKPFPEKFPEPDTWLEIPAWYVVGQITYQDIYSKQIRHTTFCGAIANTIWLNKDRDVQIHFCGVGNSMD